MVTMIATTNSNGTTRYSLTREELLELIDREARSRMHMSGTEFIELLGMNALPETVAKRDIEMWVRLLEDDGVQRQGSAVR